MTPRRLIDVKTLMEGSSMRDEYLTTIRRVSRRELDSCLITKTQKRWAEWATLNADWIMEALTAYAALEEIVDRTWVTELVWMGDPGRWELRTDTDQTGEEEGHWVGEDLHTVLRAAASDITAADEMED